MPVKRKPPKIETHRFSLPGARGRFGAIVEVFGNFKVVDLEKSHPRARELHQRLRGLFANNRKKFLEDSLKAGLTLDFQQRMVVVSASKRKTLENALSKLHGKARRSSARVKGDYKKAPQNDLRQHNRFGSPGRERVGSPNTKTG